MRSLTGGRLHDYTKATGPVGLVGIVGLGGYREHCFVEYDRLLVAAGIRAMLVQVLRNRVGQLYWNVLLLTQRGSLA